MVILTIFMFSCVILLGFLLLMGHPRQNEPRCIYRLRRHPSAIPEYLALIGYGLSRPKMFLTGATHREKIRDFPGDDLIIKPFWQETRAATIHVPVQYLWPWIVQMGGSRGGYYWWTPGEVFPEYAQFVTNTLTILPQFQNLKAGDRLSDGGPNVTDERGNWVVKAILPNHYLVLYAARQVSEGNDFDQNQSKPKGIWFTCSWVFLIEPMGDDQSRLLVRVKARGSPRCLIGILGKGDTVAHNSLFERVKTRAEEYYQHDIQSLKSTGTSLFQLD